MRIKINILSVFFFLIIASGYSQNTTLLNFEKQILNNDIDKAKALLNTVSVNKNEEAKFNYLKAKLFLLENKNDNAFESYTLAKKQYKSIDSLDKVSQINLEIVSLLLAFEQSNVAYKTYLDEYIAYAKTKDNSSYLSNAYMQLGKSFYNSNPNLAISYFYKALNENKKTSDNLFRGRILQNIGATYASDRIQKFDSALINYEKALKIYQANNESDYIFYIYVNKAVTYSKLKEYEKAIYYFSKADSVTTKQFQTKNKEALYGYMSATYKENGDFKKALEYIEKQKVYEKILDEKEQKKAINEINTKYKTVEKEQENLSLKNKNENKLILIYVSFGLLIIGSLISVLAYKNIAKKKKIIEQEKQLEIQKLQTSLKEQELNQIDVMLESQEKERQRIANELHDNLGSSLATLKMNFETLNSKKDNLQSQEKLFQKTDELIEETYQKIRNISHLKNLGVIGNEGLIQSVKKMAEKMSLLNKIQFNVIPFGLTERLDNKTEVTLFRIIQELSTNILKHANASEVNIYITQHSSTDINIMIEDNGKGFHIKDLKESQGIGLKNIERKIEQFGGTFTIDSILSKGTTIIIDIPI